MTNDEMAEMIAERNGSQRFCKNCDDCCHPYNSTDDCFKSAMGMAEWKDEQVKQLLIEKTKLLSPSAAQDSVKRCTIEEIYREMFNEEIPNSNPYIK